MSKGVDVSVIVPAYNAEDYLEECIDSILQQNGVELEIVAVDDGSTDRTGAILDAYAEQYDNITVVHQENGGISSARNTGLRHVTGKYLCYLDSDDYYATGALAQAFQMCEKQNADVLFMTYDNFYDDELAEADYPVKDIKKEIRQGDYPENPVTGLELLSCFKKNKEYSVMICMQMVRRDLLEQNGIHFEEGIIFEDAPYTFDVILHAKRALAWNKALFHYRIRNNSLCHRPADAQRCQGAFKGLLYMMEYLQEVENIAEENIDSVAAEVKRRYRFTTRTFTAIDKEERAKLRELFSTKEYVLFQAIVRPYCLLENQKKNALNKSEKYLAKMKRQQKEIEALKSQLQTEKDENNRIRNSWTFKVGKKIVGPLSRFRRAGKRK